MTEPFPSDVVDAETSENVVVKSALVDQETKKTRKKKKGGLKWDEDKIKEHDKLRGTRMKIDEPDTPYHQYDSGSETDGSHNAKNQPQLSWDHLQNKLDAAAAVREAYPSSNSSHGGGMTDEEEEELRKKEIKALEFKEHRKRHYNEMELVRKYRAEHGDDEDNDADDEDDL